MKCSFSIFIIHILVYLFSVLGSTFLYSCSSDIKSSTSHPVLSGYTLDFNSKLADKSQNINYGSEIFDAVIQLVIFNNNKGKANCTGSVVSHNTVLTSAHCFHGVTTNILGFNTNPNGSLKGEILKAKAFYTNPKFESITNDLAAVVFEDNSFNSFLEVYPGYLDIPENILTFLEDISQKTNVTEKDIIKHGAIFVGYGSKNTPTSYSTYTGTKKVGKVLISLQDNLTIYSSNNKSVNPTSSLFNTFNMGEPGDSGGPLIYKGKLVGITMAINKQDKYSLWSYINGSKDNVSSFLPKNKTLIETQRTNYNWDFLTKDLENQAVISGINSGIRTVELNGKIKVIQKYTVNTAVDPDFKDQTDLDYPSFPIYRSPSNAVIYYSPSKILSDNSTLKVGDIIVGYMSLAPVVYQYNTPNSGFTIGSFVKQVLKSSSYWERKKLPWIVIEDNQRYVVRSDLRLMIENPYDKNI